MTTLATTGLVDELCAEIERSWVDRRDREVIDRVVARHPEHAAELYDFFTSLVLGSREVVVPAEPAREAASRTRAWLEAEGFDRAAAAARRARGEIKPFVKFLQESCAASLKAIVDRLGEGVTSELLVMASRYPSLVPGAVAKELAARIEKAWKIPAAACLASLEASGLVPALASRERPYPRETKPNSFEELLKRSSLKAEERAYWLELDSGSRP